MKVIKVSFSISAYENHPSQSSREMPSLISLHGPTKSRTNWVHVWWCVRWVNESMASSKNVEKPRLGWIYYMTCLCWNLHIILPCHAFAWAKKKKKLTGKLANTNVHQAPFWFLHELEFPPFFITTIYTPDAHTQSYSTKRRNSLISSPKGTTQSQDPFFYLWLQNSDFSNFPFVNRSPKEISPRALNGVDVCRSTALWQSQTPVSISARRCGLPYLDTFPPCNLTTPALSTFIWFSFINEVAQICNNKEYWHNLS